MTEADQPFRDKIKNSQAHPILYELIPLSKKELNSKYFTDVNNVLNSALVDAINIPEIHSETGQTREKGIKPLPKKDPRLFAQEFLKKRKNVSVIVNHVVVYDTLEMLQQWLNETVDKFGIKQAIFVGGESHTISYPGPSVKEAARWVRDTFNKNRDKDDQLLVGGIVIPTRRHLNPKRDEPIRIFNKAQAGIDFFTTQVIYEPGSMKQLLNDYDALCREKGVTPKTIFISFAPISKSKDITFLKWLGVEIPKSVEQDFTKLTGDIGQESIELCKEMLRSILDYCQDENLQVPIGINVEHIMKYNIDLSYDLLVSLSKLLKIKD